MATVNPNRSASAKRGWDTRRRGKRTEFQPEAVVDGVADDVETRMLRATTVYRDQVKVLVNRGNPTGKFPSAPGEPPKKVTGLFQSRITNKVVRVKDFVIGMVGTDVPYQPRLELGFVGTDRLGRVFRQLPRPSFMPAFAMVRTTILRLLGVTGA